MSYLCLLKSRTPRTVSRALYEARKGRGRGRTKEELLRKFAEALEVSKGCWASAKRMSDGKSSSPFSPVLIGFLPHPHVLRYSQRRMQKGERRAPKITAYTIGWLKHTHTHTHTHTHKARSKEEIKGKERRRDGRGEKTRKEGRRGEGKERKRKRKIHFSNQKNLKLNVALYFQG